MRFKCFQVTLGILTEDMVLGELCLYCSHRPNDHLVCYRTILIPFFSNHPHKYIF